MEMKNELESVKLKLGESKREIDDSEKKFKVDYSDLLCKYTRLEKQGNVDRSKKQTASKNDKELERMRHDNKTKDDNIAKLGDERSQLRRELKEMRASVKKLSKEKLSPHSQTSSSVSDNNPPPSPQSPATNGHGVSSDRLRRDNHRLREQLTDVQALSDRHRRNAAYEREALRRQRVDAAAERHRLRALSHSMTDLSLMRGRSRGHLGPLNEQRHRYSCSSSYSSDSDTFYDAT